MFMENWNSQYATLAWVLLVLCIPQPVHGQVNGATRRLAKAVSLHQPPKQTLNKENFTNLCSEVGTRLNKLAITRRMAKPKCIHLQPSDQIHQPRLSFCRSASESFIGFLTSPSSLSSKASGSILGIPPWFRTKWSGLGVIGFAVTRR